MARGDLTDAQYERLLPLLPTSQGKPGRPYEDHRTVINGILWRLRTGAPWRDIPERYGPWQTCYDRFVRWRHSGVWEQILQTLQGAADAAGDVAWTVVSVDSTIVRAHQHAAGARRTPAKAEVAAAKKGEPSSQRRRSARSQPRRLHHQAAPRLRGARTPAVDRADGRTAARQHATGGDPGRHPGAPEAWATAEATGPSGV
jgi:transposase